MTFTIQESGVADRILALIGKRRAIHIPDDNKYPYGYYRAPRESFFRALFRPKSMPPGKGWIYWDEE